MPLALQLQLFDRNTKNSTKFAAHFLTFKKIYVFNMGINVPSYGTMTFRYSPNVLKSVVGPVGMSTLGSTELVFI